MATYIYYDKQGNIVETYTSYPARLGALDDEIYFYFEGHKAGGVATITAKKPDKTSGALTTFEWVDTQVKFDPSKKTTTFEYYKTYHFLKLTISIWDMAGLWSFTPTVDTDVGAVANIYVGDSTNEVPERLSFADYKYLLEEIKKLSVGHVSISETDGVITISVENANDVSTALLEDE